jgi:hypothetical protein
MDRRLYRYQRFISDIAGQDVVSHFNRPKHLIRQVRDWLATESRNSTIPGGDYMFYRFRRFQKYLPALCKRMRQNPNQMTFSDLSAIVGIWLEEREK